MASTVVSFSNRQRENILNMHSNKRREYKGREWDDQDNSKSEEQSSRKDKEAEEFVSSRFKRRPGSRNFDNNKKQMS